MAPSSSAVDPTSELLATLDLRELPHSAKGMESMEIDQMMDVPDTPDRLAAWEANGSFDDGPNRGLYKRAAFNGLRGRHRLNYTFRNGRTRSQKNPFPDVPSLEGVKSESPEVAKNPEKHQSGIKISEKLESRVPSLLPVEPSVSHTCLDATEAFSIVDKGKSETRGQTEKNKKPHDYSIHSLSSRGKGKKLLEGSGSSRTTKYLLDDIFDLESQFEESGKLDKLTSYGEDKNQGSRMKRIEPSLSDKPLSQIDRCSGAASDIFLPSDTVASVKISCNDPKGETDGIRRGYSARGDLANLTRGLKCRDNEKGVASDPCVKGEQDGLALLNSISPSRRIGQRRLVRNGCISPYNIEKSLNSFESKGNSAANDSLNANELDAGRFSEGASSTVEGNRSIRDKGKGIMMNMTAPNGKDSRARSSSRDLLLLDEDDIFKCAEETGGWRSTHTSARETFLSSSHEVKSSSKKSNSSAGNQRNTSGQDHIKELNTEASCEFVRHGPSLSFVRQSSSGRSGLEAVKERQKGAQKLIKRARKCTSVRNHFGESSSQSVEELDNLVSQSSSSRPSRMQSIIEVDDLLSPENPRPNHFQGADGMQVEASHARARQVEADKELARQVEADEKLARQLQEQFYNELSGVGDEEIDASIAWTLQREEDARLTSTSVGSHHQSHSRDSTMAHLYRHGSRSLRSTTVRSVGPNRVPAMTRMAQLRRTFCARPQRMSSGVIDFQFPSSMDMDARLQLLEALEAADNELAVTDRLFQDADSERAVSGRLFQVQRDFNEDDYEMLLALDEDNHEHGGASTYQINNLPESKVQTGNYEEVCTICLETPSMGDTIRHLPCLHKFHKECIDPWLRRRKSCPICKCGII